jgi:alkyl sulfatase BDS1-like metallo-beta-lactamase superfamily hydrolase
MMIDLDAAVLIPEFGAPEFGTENIRGRLTKTRDALMWLRTEVYDRTNLGMTDVEIIHDIVIPEWLTDEEYLKPNYGSPEYVIRDLYRQENGWWTSRNPTDLHPAHPDRVAAEVGALVDVSSVIDRAKQLIDEGDHQMAMHVLDLVAMQTGDDPRVQEARNLKADCCDALASKNSIFVSRSMLSGSARLLRQGIRRWSEHDPQRT